MLNERGSCGGEMPMFLVMLFYLIGVGIVGIAIFGLFVGGIEFAKEYLNIDIRKRMRDKWGDKC